MNTLKINVPEGFEIDKEKSTFEEIVFKPIKRELPKTWKELEAVNGYYIEHDCNVMHVEYETMSCHRNIFATEEQAKAAIALAQLSQLREVYRKGWVPDWNNTNEAKYCIIKTSGHLDKSMLWSSAHFLCFQSIQIRDEFLKNFKDLIEEASPLLFG